MKILSLLPLFFIGLFSIQIQAQTEHDTVYLYLETESNNDTVYATVKALNLENISSVQFFIEVDKSIFEVHDLVTYNYSSSNYEGALSASPANINQVGYVWSSSTGSIGSAPDDEPLLSFKLVLKKLQNEICLEFLKNVNYPIEIIDQNFKAVGVRTIGSCNNLNLTRISGQIFADLNKNCMINTGELGLRGTVIRFSNNNNTYETVAGRFGDFRKVVVPGTYDVAIYHPNQIWEICPYNLVVDANDASKEVNLNVLAKPILDCYLNEVHLINSRMRLCIDNSLRIYYQNSGTITSQDVYIELKLDERIELISSTAPYTTIDLNQYRFDVGTLTSLGSGTIDLVIKPTCDVNQLLSTLCMEARIFPNEPCNPPALWSGADLDIQSSCNNGLVEFKIKNIGVGNMTTDLNYAIVEDDLMPSGLGTIRLNKNESTTITHPANGKTIRIFTDTIPYHPYKVKFSSALEACGTISSNSKGFINRFSLGDEDPDYDIWCIQLIGSYDPNDKAGIPLGIGSDNMIQNSDRIQYMIRFQNTGSDTAFKVELIDTLSELLDLSSLEIEGASHPFTWSNENNHLLRFLFKKIQLVDSATNEKESHGYVQYSIKPKAKLKIGSRIENKADIYFDFNPAIRTNTTLHSIAGPFTIVQNPKDEQILIYPNPTSEYVIIELEKETNNTYFIMTDIFGKEVLKYPLNFGINKIPILNSLTPGPYSYRIDSMNAKGLLIKY